MNNTQWQKLQLDVKKYLISGEDFPPIEIFQEHKGAFLAFVDEKGNVAYEESCFNNEKDVISTLKVLCNKLKEKNIPHETIKKHTLHLCLLKDSIYLKNKMDWEIGKDGLCFLWGDKLRGYYMPYETVRMNLDKIRILDKLCSHKCNTISLWRLPEGLVFRLNVEWYK